MIFKFRIVSDGTDNFKRVIEIDAQSTFLDLKNAICDSVGYDKMQMDSFFICDDNWEKRKEITFEDMDFDSDEDVYLMEDAYLEDFIDDEGQRLLYVFDYMTDRAFFMEMTEMIPGRTLKDPFCSLSQGKAPAQMMDIEEFDKQLEAKAAKRQSEMELDDELFTAEGYDPDDLATLSDDTSLY